MPLDINLPKIPRGEIPFIQILHILYPYILNNLPFGNELKLFLTAKSNKSSNNTIEETTVWLGKKCLAFEAVEYNENDGSFFFTTSSHLDQGKEWGKEIAFLSILLMEDQPMFRPMDCQFIFQRIKAVLKYRPQHWPPYNLLISLYPIARFSHMETT